jgi:hypothetical protein
MEVGMVDELAVVEVAIPLFKSIGPAVRLKGIGFPCRYKKRRF